MPDNNEAPTPRRSRAKTLANVQLDLSNDLAATALEALTPAQRAMLEPSDVGQIQRTSIAAAESIAETVRAAEARTNG